MLKLVAALARGASAVPGAIQPEPPVTTCDKTVAYLFVVHEELPLVSTWEDYFAGCDQGAYTVHMHWQTVAPGGATPEEVAKRLPGARMLDDPVLGDLRFSYKMQDVMLRLYEDAAESIAPNGCRPRWAKLLSESCAPLAQCHEVHDYLASQHGVSQFNAGIMPGTTEGRAPEGWPETLQFWKASQWSTLWMDHAKLLLQHAKEARPRWERTLCPDEHYSINELSRLGAQLVTQSNPSTEDLWRARWLDSREDMEGFPQHPRVFLCSPEAVHLSEVPAMLPTQQLARRSVTEFNLFIDRARNQR